MLLAASVLLLNSGCNRFRHDRHDTVYVAARQMYLHDRVAAVSNRVAQVDNGQKLEVIDHARRFLKVKTEKNEIGWIEERAVIDSKTYDAFADLSKAHKDDPVVATAVLRDDLYLHLQPGRDTQRFFLVAGNAKVQLLMRTSVVKTPTPGSVPVAPAKPAATANPAAGANKTTPEAPASNSAPAKPAAAEAPAPPPSLEDWWLVRDPQGRAGWLLASRLDVDVPDEIGLFAEGQRIVGAYVLTKVFDSESQIPDHMVPEYVTVMSPLKSGLPYDFDQVRVFTWSLKKHRYETAFRLRPIQGYLPLQIGQQQGQRGQVPAFSFQIANVADTDTPPAPGSPRPGNLRTLRYSLNDTQVKREGPDLAPLPNSKKQEDKKDAAGKDGKKGKGKGKKKK
jgi:hypothetical protein